MGDIVEFPTKSHDKIILIENMQYNIDKDYWDSLSDSERIDFENRLLTICQIVEDLINI